jgi:hypothetical protein
MLAYVARHFNALAPLLRRQIRLRYGFDLAAHAYNGARAWYRRMLAAFPSIGDDHPLADITYGALVVLALYRNAEGELTPEMLRTVLADFFETLPLRPVVSVTNDLNRPADMRRMGDSVRAIERWTAEHPQAQACAWDIICDSEPTDARVAFHLTRCPIHDFCREQGLLEVMPAICDLGHMGCALIGGRLTREHMLSAGDDLCDYLIEGDQTPVRP